MTDIEATQIIPADQNPAARGNGHGNPSSVLAALKARRAEFTHDQTYDITVPGYDGLLVLRCGPVPGPRFSQVTDRYVKSRAPERDFNLGADVLVASCRDVLARARLTDELQPLDPEVPMTIDARLAEALGIESVSGRELVRELFIAAPMPEAALGQAVSEFMEWATGVNADADEEFAGESQAAPS